jgi:hypothetical protein
MAGSLRPMICKVKYFLLDFRQIFAREQVFGDGLASEDKS